MTEQPPALPKRSAKNRKPRAYASVSARIPQEQKRILDDLALTTGISVDDLVRFALVKMLMDGASALLTAKQAQQGAAKLLASISGLPEADDTDHANDGVDG